MTKNPDVSRREFMQLLMASGFTATAAGALLSLTGCGGEQASEVTAQPSATTAPTAEAVPTGETAVPTGEPATETPSEEPAATGTDLAIARSSSPTALVQAAVAALEGHGSLCQTG